MRFFLYPYTNRVVGLTWWLLLILSPSQANAAVEAAAGQQHLALQGELGIPGTIVTLNSSIKQQQGSFPLLLGGQYIYRLHPNFALGSDALIDLLSQNAAVENAKKQQFASRFRHLTTTAKLFFFIPFEASSWWGPEREMRISIGACLRTALARKLGAKEASKDSWEEIKPQTSRFDWGFTFEMGTCYPIGISFLVGFFLTQSFLAAFHAGQTFGQEHPLGPHQAAETFLKACSTPLIYYVLSYDVLTLFS